MRRPLKQLLVALIMIGCVAAGCVAPVAAQESTPTKEKDHSIVFEFGWEGDWSHDEGLHNGGTLAFEVTPIENWLELEFGVTAIHAAHGTEIPIDLLFKKPWRLSRQVEFMAGLGPEIVHETGADHGTFWGVSSVLDFMFWPRTNIGWYLEPGYEVTFRNGARNSGLGMAAGLIVGR